MWILGIESSCDETAAAVLSSQDGIVSNVIASQYHVHSAYGGVVPELASRAHLRNLVPVVRQALSEAHIAMSDLNAIGVTRGPGLVGSLLVGLTYAKALAYSLSIPFVAVNHIEGHIHAVLQANRQIVFPALAFVVSGGHTHLYLLPEPDTYHLLAKTRDDAAGEAYDKVAKLLGFGYPGGPVLDRLAPYGNDRAVRFSRTRVKSNPLDLSFSGLKTAVLRWVESQPDMNSEIARRSAQRDQTLQGWLAVTPTRTLDLIAGFQRAVIDEIFSRIQLAAASTGARSLIVTGGVSANAGMRSRAAEMEHLNFYFPEPKLATDNAAMIAAAALSHLERGTHSALSTNASANLPLT